MAFRVIVIRRTLNVCDFTVSRSSVARVEGEQKEFVDSCKGRNTGVELKGKEFGPEMQIVNLKRLYGSLALVGKITCLFALFNHV